MVSHITVGNLFPRTELREISIPTNTPFLLCSHEPESICEFCEKAAAINTLLGIAIRTVALNRIHRDGSTVPKLFNGLPHILFLTAFATSEVRLLRNRAATGMGTSAREHNGRCARN